MEHDNSTRCGHAGTTHSEHMVIRAMHGCVTGEGLCVCAHAVHDCMCVYHKTKQKGRDPCVCRCCCACGCRCCMGESPSLISQIRNL